MFQQLITLLIGIAGGVAVGIQPPITNAISQRLGSASSNLIVHITGAIYAGLLLIVNGGEQIAQWRTLPWWMFGVGAFGVFLFATTNFTIPRIGAAAAISLIIAGQLTTGMIIDHFGIFGVELRTIDPTRLFAVGLLLLGGYLLAR